MSRIRHFAFRWHQGKISLRLSMRPQTFMKPRLLVADEGQIGRGVQSHCRQVAGIDQTLEFQAAHLYAVAAVERRFLHTLWWERECTCYFPQYRMSVLSTTQIPQTGWNKGNCINKVAHAVKSGQLTVKVSLQKQSKYRGNASGSVKWPTFNRVWTRISWNAVLKRHFQDVPAMSCLVNPGSGTPKARLRMAAIKGQL